jgi:hypothetical protein
MGGICHGVMLAIHVGKASEHLKDGRLWDDLLSKYEYRSLKPEVGELDPSADEWGCLVGFWVAHGDAGWDGCPPLDLGFALDDFLEVSQYNKAYEAAVIEWKTFMPWLRSQGVKLGEPPRLYLVQTEVY